MECLSGTSSGQRQAAAAARLHAAAEPGRTAFDRTLGEEAQEIRARAFTFAAHLQHRLMAAEVWKHRVAGPTRAPNTRPESTSTAQALAAHHELTGDVFQRRPARRIRERAVAHPRDHLEHAGGAVGERKALQVAAQA